MDKNSVDEREAAARTASMICPAATANSLCGSPTNFQIDPLNDPFVLDTIDDTSERFSSALETFLQQESISPIISGKSLLQPRFGNLNTSVQAETMGLCIDAITHTIATEGVMIVDRSFNIIAASSVCESILSDNLIGVNADVWLSDMIVDIERQAFAKVMHYNSLSPRTFSIPEKSAEISTAKESKMRNVVVSATVVCKPIKQIIHPVTSTSYSYNATSNSTININTHTKGIFTEVDECKGDDIDDAIANHLYSQQCQYRRDSHHQNRCNNHHRIQNQSNDRNHNQNHRSSYPSVQPQQLCDDDAMDGGHPPAPPILPSRVHIRRAKASLSVASSTTSGETSPMGTCPRDRIAYYILAIRDTSSAVEPVIQDLRRLLSTVESVLPLAHVEADENMIITKFNSVAQQMFGLTAARVIGKNVSVLMPDTIEAHIPLDSTPHRSRSIKKHRSLHDVAVRNFLARVRCAGTTDVQSNIVNRKVHVEAIKLDDEDPRSLRPRAFPAEMEIKICLSAKGEIAFHAFFRDKIRLRTIDEISLHGSEDSRSNESVGSHPDDLKLSYPTPVAGERELVIIAAELTGIDSIARRLGAQSAFDIKNDIFTCFRNLCSSHEHRLLHPVSSRGDEFIMACGFSECHDNNDMSPRKAAVNEAVIAIGEMDDIVTARHHDTGLEIGVRIGVDFGKCFVAVTSGGVDVVGNIIQRASSIKHIDIAKSDNSNTDSNINNHRIAFFHEKEIFATEAFPPHYL